MSTFVLSSLKTKTIVLYVLPLLVVFELAIQKKGNITINNLVSFTYM
jgi:hypothetical protein